MKSNLQKISFKSLMLTQFLGAFNDNAYKIFISLYAIQVLSSKEAHTTFVSLIAALFIIPFVIFSPYAGYCADRFYKRDVLVFMKIVEVAVMGFGYFALLSGNLILICAILFLMALHSTFFGPSKYGILPEMLDDHELSQGNGHLQMWTFLAIILGTAWGGQMMVLFKNNIQNASIVLTSLSLIGLTASFYIDKRNAVVTKKPFQWNMIKESVHYFRCIKAEKPLFLTLWAIAYFWFFGAVIQMNTLLYGKGFLHLSEVHTSLLIVAASVGIGLGSFLAGKFSGGKIEFGLVPMGSIGMSIFTMLLGWPSATFLSSLIMLLVLGIFAGFFIVPLNAFFQQQSPAENRGKYLAVLNIFNSLTILFGSLFLWLLGVVLHLNPAQVYFVLGISSVAATIYIFKTLPASFLRLFNWMITHTIYKVRIQGQDNVPPKGGALLVCNHVSYADPSLVMASIQRHIRFLMYRVIYNNKILNPLCKVMKAIPVSMKDPPKEILKSLQTARDAVEAGELVCIFAEGALTRTGLMLTFNKGFEKIMKGLTAPIIPVYIDSIWGSIFSFEREKYFWKIPKMIPYPVSVIFGKSLPADSKAHQVRLAVQELSVEGFHLRGENQEKLAIAFVSEAKRHPFKFCLADSTGLKLNYIQALGSTFLLSHQLFPIKNKSESTQEMVGIMLPCSAAGALVNGAVFMAGKIPVNLNFTASKDSLDSAIRQCQMKTIITSRKFLEKVNIETKEGMVYLEDVMSKVSNFKKILWILISLILPSSLLKRFFVCGDKKNIEDTATVIFSSGSTGEPKGVMLSHKNISSNIQGFYQVANIKENDIVMGVLPFFHSFGFTAGLCFPAGTGAGVVYHNNPLDAAMVGKLVEQFKATIILGTPTFFSSYIRKCTKEQFKTIRYAIAGAEKLNEKIAAAFKEKFGIVPLEGYGATELSPIVSLGVPNPDNTDETIIQYGHKEGKVGHPIPGVAAKVVDPDSMELKGFDEDGLLLIKGPNVMKGYLHNEEKTREVIKDGWYITGDIASIDKEGFIHITDRLSRFSKIGGEMVPHQKIEEEILNILGASDPVCAVTAVPDEKKGEKLVVLFRGEISVDKIIKQLGEKGLPNLWIPKKECFIQIKEIPLLGSGKRDLRTIKDIAREHFEGEGEAYAD